MLRGVEGREAWAEPELLMRTCGDTLESPCSTLCQGSFFQAGLWKRPCFQGCCCCLTPWTAARQVSLSFTISRSFQGCLTVAYCWKGRKSNVDTLFHLQLNNSSGPPCFTLGKSL